MSSFDYEASFVEVRFPCAPGTHEPVDNFLKVKETLTRIGAPAYDRESADRPRILWQSCHILHKRQRYYIVHYKQLFLLDGKQDRTDLTDHDLGRLNTIVRLLTQWGLVEVVDPSRILTPPPVPVDSIKIIPYRDKHQWSLRAKYEIGKRKS